MYITFQLCVSHWSDTNVREEWARNLFCMCIWSNPISLYFQSSHLPWQSRPVHWLQPGAHTPTSRSTLLVSGPSVAWDSLAQAASRPLCSAAHRQSARHGTYTDTCSWGRTSGRSGRLNHPKHRHLPHELEDRSREKWHNGFILLYK